MIKSNFQLQKEKERSILDCITSITGKLDEATVVGFTPPMGGIAKPQFSSSLGRPGEGPALAGTPESKLSGEELEAARRNAVSKPVTSTSNLNNSSTPTQSAFNNNNPNWAKQRAKALTNPVLPPLQAGQSTPFVAKGPFVPQGQAQQPQAAQYQTAMAGTVPAGALPVGTGMAMQSAQQAAEVKGRDAWERSRAGKFDYKNEVLPSANFDPVVIDARKALANTQSAASTPSTQPGPAAPTSPKQTTNMPSYLPQTAKPSPDIVELSPDERYKQTMAGGNFSGATIATTAGMSSRSSGQVQSAGDAQAIASAKEIAMTPEQREARKVAREAAEDKQEIEKERIHKRLQAQRTARNVRETERLTGEEAAQKNRETERDQNRRRYSRPIYNQDGSVTDSYSGENINTVSSGGNNGSGSRGSRGIVSSGRLGSGGGGGSRLPESFNPSSSRLEEIAGVGPAGVIASNAAHAATQAYNNQIKNAVATGAKTSIDFIKDYAPKVGYIVGTPPRELAATATGRLSGLGFSKQGAEERFNYYRTGLNKLGNAGANLATGLAGAFLGSAAAKAAKAAPTSVGGKLLGVAGQLGKDVFDVINPKQYVSAAADEAATLTGAALYDPRMAGMNFKTTKK